MKNLAKRIVALSVATAMCLGMSAFAEIYHEKMEYINADTVIHVDGKGFTIEEISVLTHLSVTGLIEYYKKDSVQFEEDLREKLSLEDSATTYAVDSSGTATKSFPELMGKGYAGNIVISGTNTSNNWRHGHAAVYYSESHIVHAPGGKKNSEYTKHSDFGKTEKVRLYKVEPITTANQIKVAEYAKASLVDKPYNWDANSDSKTELNCATLVWQAYKTQNISLKNYFYTTTPETLVQDIKTEIKANLNWTGDGNSWSIG